MPFNPLTIVLTVIGGLVVAGLVGWIKRPRLIVLVPRMFSYSQITDRGHLVEISIFNRGFKTEEAIDVTLNHALSYEMIGSNSQDVTVRENRLNITRIGPSDEVTALLLVEKGTFKPDDIVQYLSKETKGVVVSKLEEVSPTGNQRIGLVAGLIGFPLILYASTLGMDYLLSASKQTAATTKAETSPIVEIQGWKVPRFYESTSPSLFTSFAEGKISVSVAPISRKGDSVSVQVRVANLTVQVIKVNLDMTTAASAKKLKSFELSTGEMLLVPGKSEERVIRVIVPANSIDQMEKVIFVEAFIRDTGGDTLSIKRDYPVN